jgi:hypothetical protein
MTLPGFTAELSFGRPRNQYRLGPPIHQRDSALHPAANSCYYNCIGQCPENEPYYICKHNCMCQCYGIPSKTCHYM